MKTPKNPAQARAAAIKNHARTEGRSPAEVLAAYTTPQPPEHLRVHHLAAHMIPAPSPSNPLPPVPLVCPKGEAYVVLDHLAWNLDAGRAGVAELEAHAHAWAAGLPAHHQALAELWVNGFPIAPVPCLRWPLLRAFLQSWQGGGRPGTKQQRLLAALAQDAEQVAPEALEGAAATKPGRPEKVSAEKVHEIYRLKELEGKTWMEVANATQLGVSTCREIAAGRYPFTSPSAKEAWSETFGAKNTPC
jgi:hypothetical protein